MGGHRRVPPTLSGLLLPPFRPTPFSPSSNSPGALRGGSGQRCKSPAVHERKKTRYFRGSRRLRASLGSLQVQARALLVRGTMAGTVSARELGICRIERAMLPLATPDLSTAQGRKDLLALQNRCCACFSKPLKIKAIPACSATVLSGPFCWKTGGKENKWNELSTRAQLPDTTSK